MLCEKSKLLSLSNKLEGRSKWKVARGEKNHNEDDNAGKDRILK